MKSFTTVYSQLGKLSTIHNQKIQQFTALKGKEKNTITAKELFGEINFYAGQINALNWVLQNENGKRNSGQNSGLNGGKKSTGK